MSTPESSSTENSLPEASAPDARHQEAVDRFVSFWGEMASKWGINRTMAQVYAFLYCAERPLNTDEIMEQLQISRGSANMNLRELVDWELAEKTRVPNSRKDHYEAEKDVWQVTARIIEERERREVRPVREQLQAVADHLVPEKKELEDCPDANRELYERLENLIELIEVFEGVSEALLPLVKGRKEALIRRLISLAQALETPEAPNGSESEKTEG